MTHSKRGSLSRFFGLGLLVAGLLAVTFGPAGELEAWTRCGTEHRYYADAAKTQHIGTQIWTPTSCGCDLIEWGQISFYRTILDYYDCF